MERNVINENSGDAMPLVHLIDKNILSFLNQLTESWKDEYDLIMFYEILNGKRFENGNTLFRLRIGSGRHIQPLYEKMKTLPFFYDEFVAEVKLTSKLFHLRLTLFHNSENTKEEFSYLIDPAIGSGIPQINRIFPQEKESQEAQLFFDEILLLLKLNREIRVYSEVTNADE